MTTYSLCFTGIRQFACPSRRHLDVQERFQPGFHDSAPPGPSVAVTGLDFLQRAVGVVPDRVDREYLGDGLPSGRRLVVAKAVASGVQGGRRRLTLAARQKSTSSRAVLTTSRATDRACVTERLPFHRGFRCGLLQGVKVSTQYVGAFGGVRLYSYLVRWHSDPLILTLRRGSKEL